MFPTWLRSLVKLVNNGKSSRLGRKRAGRSRHSFRPRFEQFEDRLVPTSIHLSTNLITPRSTTVQVAISVDTLLDASHGNKGLEAGDFEVFYDQSVFTLSSPDVSPGTITFLGSSANGSGFTRTSATTASNGWALLANTNIAGQLNISLSTSGVGITQGSSGTLVLINFHVKSNAPLGTSMVDLAADTGGGSPATELTDFNTKGYTLNPAPVDNVDIKAGHLFPYVYTPSTPADTTDSAITVTGVNPPPVAVNDSYSVTARAIASDPGLVEGANAVQTLTFSGSPLAGTFTLTFNNQTATINYSTVASTLQSNIQAALAGLSAIGTGKRRSEPPPTTNWSTSPSRARWAPKRCRP